MSATQRERRRWRAGETGSIRLEVARTMGSTEIGLGVRRHGTYSRHRGVEAPAAGVFRVGYGTIKQ